MFFYARPPSGGFVFFWSIRVLNRLDAHEIR
jgi:hypothetical protein